ncbi:hypothetical protein ACVWVS_003389 [Ewingella americana]
MSTSVSSARAAGCTPPESGDTQHDVVALALVEQRQNVGCLTAFQVHQNGGDDLRMLVADQVGRNLWLHEVEGFHAGGGFARLENIFQQAGGALFAQGFGQYRTQVLAGVNTQRGVLLGFVFKLAQHVAELLVGNLMDVGHRATDLLNFTRVEVLEHLHRAVFTQRDH